MIKYDAIRNFLNHFQNLIDEVFHTCLFFSEALRTEHECHFTFFLNFYIWAIFDKKYFTSSVDF